MKIVTYNILAQRYYNDAKYEWDFRLELINKILSRSNADVICLQEIELASFRSDFKNILNEYDYFGHVNNSKRTSPIGNIILWKKSVFNALEMINTSCSNIVVLQNNITNQQIKLANVHLKAGIYNPECIKTRISQLQSICKKNPDILCGDFNDDFKTNLEIIKLISKYIIHNKFDTCYTSEQEEDFTWCFDNILTRENLYEINIEYFIKPYDKFLRDKKLPDEFNPSDHIPLIITLNPI